MPDSIDRLRAALANRYRIERELGHGGNAVVYLAQDLKHNRQVALKVLLPELALSVRTERFLREIQIAAQLTHPHILPLYDSGEIDGCLYYVMPYVAGEPWPIGTRSSARWATEARRSSDTPAPYDAQHPRAAQYILEQGRRTSAWRRR